MRITLVTETYFPQINGVSRSLRQLTQYLLSRGVDVQLAVPRYAGGENTVEPGCRIRELPSFPLPFYPEIRVVASSPGRIGSLLTDFAADLVHIATEGPLGLAALRAARARNIPMVSSYHTNFAQYLQWYGVGVLEGPLFRYLRWFHNTTSATYCPTPSIQHMLSDKGFRRVTVWGRGVDTSLFSPDRGGRECLEELGIRDRETPSAVYVGRLAAEKNLDLLLDAMALLPETAGCRLIMVGDGPRRRHLEARSNGRVVFAGYRRGAALAALIASCDFMVFPSVTETFGNVVLEGMASGLPVIAFDTAGPGDIIRDGETGILVSRTQADCLAQAIAGLAADRITRQQLGKHARAYALTQSWEAVNEVVLNGYREVLHVAG